jgi:hypothetical protein
MNYLKKFNLTGDKNASGTAADKKQIVSTEVTKLQKLLGDAGPVRPDGSDKYYGMENVSSSLRPFYVVILIPKSSSDILATATQSYKLCTTRRHSGKRSLPIPNPRLYSYYKHNRMERPGQKRRESRMELR